MYVKVAMRGRRSGTVERVARARNKLERLIETSAYEL